MGAARPATQRLGPGWISATALAWALADVLSVLLASAFAMRLRGMFQGVQTDHHQYRNVLAVDMRTFFMCVGWYAACVVFFSQSYRLYSGVEGRSGLNELRMTLQASAVSGLVLCGTLYVFRGEVISRVIVLLLVIFSALIISSRRAVWRSMVYARYRDGVATRNVMILGSGRVGRALRNHLESLRHMGFRFKGFIAITDEELASGDPDIIGGWSNCLQLARGLFVDELFLSVPADRKKVIAMVQEARQYDIDVRVVPDLYDGLAWNAPVEYVGQFPTIPLHRRNFAVGSYMLKRMLDLVVASALLLALAPMMALIALCVAIDSGGPIFYNAKRIGRKGRMFNCHKFRTMVKNADALKADVEHLNERDGILFKATNDPRVTRVGRILRKYSLDEIPQFFNVLRGDMSLVGPRPPMAAEVEKYDLSHLRRLDVLPGITGLWQVEARQDPSFDSYISLDTAYVENWTIWLDLKILMRTVSVVFSGTGS